MRLDLRTILDRQAEWQRSRAHQTWADKLRMAIRMREDLKSIRKSRTRDDPRPDIRGS